MPLRLGAQIAPGDTFVQMRHLFHAKTSTLAKTVLAVAAVLSPAAWMPSNSQAADTPSPWVQTPHRLAHGSSTLVTETPWAGVTYNVAGPKFAMWFLATERGGKALVLVNGKRAKTVDMYAKRTARKAVSLRGSSGQNVVQVIALPDRNTASLGNRVNVDAFSRTARACVRGCTRTPAAANEASGEVAATGTWYPQAVPDTTSEWWPVAISSYVRGADTAPIDAARPMIRAAACETGRRVKRGVIVLSFGKQIATGANGFGKQITYANVAEVARAWAAGLAECGTGPWEVAISTSNSGGVTAYNGYAGGGRWAQLVEAAAAGADPRVVMSAGVDLEPGWGPPGQARAWVDGYVAASGKRLWNFGSADGCPQTYLSKLTCNNGWTVDDIIWVSSRAGVQVVAMPQLHTQTGSLARQWAVLAERSVATGDPMRIAAVGVQTAACAQRRGGCPTTGESAWNAWAKLRGLLDARPATRSMPLGAPRDIRWGWGSGFVIPTPTTTTTTTLPKTTSTTLPKTTTTVPTTTTTVTTPTTVPTTTTTVPAATTTTSTSPT